jgi:chaperonin cofactor prefoldin
VIVIVERVCQQFSALCWGIIMQEHHFATLQRETERLRTDIDKMRSELRYEIDKVTSGQRLDLNLERGRIREELATQSSETSNLTNKLDREIHTLKTQLEAAKYDVIKYCIGEALWPMNEIVLFLP